MSRVAIVVDGVSKRFRLQRDRASSVKEAVISRRRRRRDADEVFWALRDVSLEVPEGNTYGVIGHNGSGKSTLLRLMAGIHRPTAGTVTTNGRISALLELGSGFHPDLTGRENVYLNGAMLGLSRAYMRQSLDDIVDFSGLHEWIDEPVKVYSSGMYVRLGFAVAVHVDPEILLVDEVMAVGDEEFQRRCLDHMYALRRDGITIVFVSHSLAMVESMCDEVAWLDHGRMLAQGQAVDVIPQYTDAVNRAEAERRTAEQEQLDAQRSVELEGFHHGSGEIRIYHVDVLDEEWERLPYATTGDQVLLRLWYDAQRQVERPVFSFEIHHETGTHIGGVSTHDDGVDTGVIEVGQGFVDFVMPRMPLSPGSYAVSTKVTNGDEVHVFDQASRIVPLVVRSRSVDGQRGLVQLEGTFAGPTPWEVERT